MPTKVKPIPEGYHTLTPMLTVKDAAAVIDFYKKAFAAEERFRMPTPDGKGVMHAELKIGDSVFMLGEEMPEHDCKSPSSVGGTPVSFYVYVEDVDAAFKTAVDAGAKVKMPVEKYVLGRPNWRGDRSLRPCLDFQRPTWKISAKKKSKSVGRSSSQNGLVGKPEYAQFTWRKPVGSS